MTYFFKYCHVLNLSLLKNVVVKCNNCVFQNSLFCFVGCTKQWRRTSAVLGGLQHIMWPINQVHFTGS